MDIYLIISIFCIFLACIFLLLVTVLVAEGTGFYSISLKRNLLMKLTPKLKEDRELLELAAKAAGIEVRQWRGHLGAEVYGGSEDSPYIDFWNPLTDDGDALRLLNKVGLRLHVGRAYSNIIGKSGDVVISVPHSIGADAATRRAITRAAAEIRKAMK